MTSRLIRQRAYRWITGDPQRAFIGDEPPEKVRIVPHLTKNIASIRFQKVAGSKLSEEWFDGTLLISPGLVAIIGNKANGKTVLAEAIGLLGTCESADSFSFLNASKFRQSKNNKAREFQATLTWRNGHPVTRKLSDQTDPDMPRDVSYIPQSYLEAICNEVNNTPGSKFDSELKLVIFSHVAEHKMLNAESFDELIRFQTGPVKERIETLRAELHDINSRVLELEARSSVANRQLLLNLKASRTRTEAHDKLKPAEIVKPEADPAQQAAMKSISQQIVEANTKTGAWLRIVVQGSLDSLGLFRDRVLRYWGQALKRRSQRHRYAWVRRLKLAAQWLPTPRVLHLWPVDRFAATHPR